MSLTLPGVGPLSLPADTTVPTPAQFDTSQKAVNAAFVQRMGIQSSTITALPAGASTLTAANVGQTIAGTGTNVSTANVPPASTCPAGSHIEFVNTSTGALTVNRQGADLIFTSNASVPSMVLGPGDNLMLVSNGNNAWIATYGSTQLGYAAAFGSSIGASIGSGGYQKLPSGLIVQWGGVPAIASGQASSVVTFPIAFPTVCIGVVGTPVGASQGTLEVLNFGSTTQVTFGEGSGAAGKSISAGLYIAIGK